MRREYCWRLKESEPFEVLDCLIERGGEAENDLRAVQSDNAIVGLDLMTAGSRDGSTVASSQTWDIATSVQSLRWKLPMKNGFVWVSRGFDHALKNNGRNALARTSDCIVAKQRFGYYSRSSSTR